MNITGSKTTDFSVTAPDNITGSRTEEKEVKKKNVYVAETNSLITVPEDYTPAQQISAARQEEFEKINEYTDSQKFWNKYVFDPTKSTGRFAKTLLKSAANQTVDLTGGSLLRLEEWAENTGAEIAYDVAKEKGMDYPGVLLELRKDAIERNRNLLDKAMFNIGEEESEIAQNLGSGAVSIGSMFLAWGLGNKRFALDLAKIFGLSSGTSMYENLTLAGAPYDTATYRGAVAGISEYALEKAGFEWVTNRIQNRLLYPITKRFIEPGFAGAVQESLQEGKDILLEEGYIESTPEEKFDRLSTAAIYGAILETAGANVGYELYRRRMRENLRQAAIEDGYDTKTADKMAKAATPSTNEMLNILRDEERRTLDGLEKFTPEQMEEYEKSLELTRNLPTEDAAAEVQFYDGLKNVILEGGIEENEARRQAAYWSLMVKNDYELAKESGTYQGNMAEFQRDWLNLNVANRKNTRAVKTGNRVVETPVRMSEDEISEAWAARQQERQMSDEEREFFAERPSRKLFSLGDRQTDFTEFRGNPEGAIEKLLQEKNGYVSGAVYKEGIGDIDFIYGQPGKNGYGLAHIIERRNQQGINGEEFVREIPKIINQGVVYDILGVNDRKYILSSDKETIIRLDLDGEKRNWLLTAYMKKSRALPALRTSSGQIYLDEPITSSNPASENNISSDTENVNNKLFSTGETVRGTYDPSERLIELFADAKPDTLTHELSHHFFQNHFRVAQEYGFSDYDRGVMKWLSKRGKHDITGFADMQDQDWENLTEAFIRYLNTDTAPTIATRGLFQKAKEWVLGVYDDNRDYASNEVKDFFDALVSREGTIPNLDNIIKNKADFEESIKQALRGESATFRGMNRGELRKLRQATHTRVRRPGRTLEQELRALGYRVDAVNRTLADEKGVVDDVRLAEILQEMGVLDNVDTETYEQTDALSAKMQDILANAATTYSPREAKIQQERDASIRNQAEAQRFIDELLQNNQLGIKTIEELDELLAKVVSKPDDVDVVKVNRNAIKYLQTKTAEMNKDYQEAIRQIRQEEKVRRETQYQLQNRMKNFIRSLPVTGDHKASLMGNIQRVKDAESFEAVLNDVRRRAAGYIEQEQKQLNRRNIEETIKSTKPTKFRKQRYTYEDNKFFAELRDILKMSRAEALAAQEAFAGQIGLARADGEVPLGINISEYDRLKNLLYYYKINGAESSLAALQDLATSLEELKAAAADKRLDEDTLKSEVRKKDKDELLEGINKYKASNIFARGMAKIGTIRSAMSEYFGKEMADKWNLEPAFERVNIFMRSRIKPVMDSAREIYGAAKASDFLNLMQNKSQKEFELTDNDGDYDKLSIMDIADIYIGMKDPNTRANYYAAYEKFDDTMPTDRGQLRAAIETMSDEQLREHMLTNNLGTLLSYLSEQDMRFADMVQEEVGSMWELENEIFVKLYGIDLPQNRNYFPRTSKNAQDYDVMENLRVRSQTPGFFKERASTVTPRPKNIWTKYQEYVTSVGYVQNVALKYKDLHSLMTDKAIRGAIVKKYGEDSYRAFMANLDDLSIKGAVKTYNEVGRTMQKLLNNLVSGTVALNVPMAFKQLPAALNYSVNMPKTEFIKNFLYAATHPAEVKRVMDSYVGDFLKTRYEQGSQSDAIGRAMAEADSLVNSKFGLAGFSHNWRQLATTPIRFADIFAIYWGGYAKLKYNIDRGLAPEKIREDFIDETLSNQAAGNPATLAKFQREQSLRFFTAFRNVPAQYMRLITTTMTQWRRGEISDARFFSNIGNYVFVQPALYIWLGWLVKSFLYGDDDDEWFDGMMTEMALSPIAGLPIIADLASFGLDKAESALTGKSPEPWDALQVFGVDTLNKLMWKLVKDDKTGWDWAEIAASVIDVGTGAGLGTAVRTVKKLSD